METEVREKEFSGKVTLLDKYILKQIIEMFIMGVCVFTSIIFASELLQLRLYITNLADN